MNLPRGLALVLSLSLSLLASTAHALEFRVISWEGAIEGLFFDNAPKPVQILAQEGTLSPLYRKNGTAPLALFRETLVDEKLVRTPVPVPAPPEGLQRGILLLVRVPNAAQEAYTGEWIDYADELNPPGTVRFCNYSSHPLALESSGEQWRQNPGEHRKLTFDVSRRAMQVQMAALLNQQWQRVANVSQPVRPGHRLLVILRDGRASAGIAPDPVEMIVLYDYTKPAP